MGRLFVRRTQRSQVLRVKCEERGGDSRSYPYDAFFHVWPKQCDPKIAAKEQLRALHRGGAAGVTGAIMIHLSERRGCIIDNTPPPTGSMAVFIHLDSTTRACWKLDVIFFCRASKQR